MLINNQLLFAMQNNLNVLMVGPHGAGKTQRIKDLWTAQGYSINQDSDKVALYMNGPTLDVYDDLKGVPFKDDNGDLVYIKPKHWLFDKAEFIFIDEPNRAHPKVINSLYEMIQFRSINGQRLPRLRAVWGAMNPENQNYSVESCDQSFYDRFHLIINIESRLDKEYFSQLIKNEDILNNVVSWWTSIPEKNRINYAPPRRVEYAIRMFNMGLRDFTSVFNDSINGGRLLSILSGDTKPPTIDLSQTIIDVDLANDILLNPDKYIDNGPCFFLDAFCKIPYEISLSAFEFRKVDQNHVINFMKLMLKGSFTKEKVRYIVLSKGNLLIELMNFLSENKDPLFSLFKEVWEEELDQSFKSCFNF